MPYVDPELLRHVISELEVRKAWAADNDRWDEFESVVCCLCLLPNPEDDEVDTGLRLIGGLRVIRGGA